MRCESGREMVHVARQHQPSLHDEIIKVVWVLSCCKTFQRNESLNATLVHKTKPLTSWRAREGAPPVTLAARRWASSALRSFRWFSRSAFDFCRSSWTLILAAQARDKDNKIIIIINIPIRQSTEAKA